MDIVDQIFELLSRILLVPSYYTPFERNVSLGATVLFVLVGYILAKLISTTNAIRLVLTLAIVILAIVYWFFLYNLAGVFLVQLGCRAIIATLLAWVLSAVATD